MPEPSPAPFDPSEFTAEELQLARQFLLALRRRPPEPPPPPVTRTPARATASSGGKRQAEGRPGWSPAP
jgi:hypothetical protein